ncbi:hypothetical protein [Alkalicella caledoniensis]|nr:hypothetical protein [Alkalicella caledoniensis]
MSKRIFTIDEDAQIFNMHSRTIRRYIKEGSLNGSIENLSW